MKSFLNLTSILVFVLCVILLLQRFDTCNPKPKDKPKVIMVEGKPYEVIKRIVDTFVVNKVKTIYKKGDSIPYYVRDTIYIPVSVDTLEIVKSYFKQNIYKDTIVLDDSLGYLVVIDTVSQNKIQGRLIKSDITRKTIAETTIVKELPKNQVYVGFNSGLDKYSGINSVSGGVIYKSKSDKIYQVNVGLLNKLGDNGGLSPFVSGGLYWKLKLH